MVSRHITMVFFSHTTTSLIILKLIHIKIFPKKIFDWTRGKNNFCKNFGFLFCIFSDTTRIRSNTLDWGVTRFSLSFPVLKFEKQFFNFEK